MNTTYLLIFFLAALIIPTVYIYVEHGIKEIGSSEKSKESGNITKYIRGAGEGYFFVIVAIGYSVVLGIIILKPNLTIPYYVLIFGTLGIIIMYYLRTTTGIPVIGTDVWIKEYLVDWSDVISKIAQQALVIPATVLLMKARRNQEE